MRQLGDEGVLAAMQRGSRQDAAVYMHMEASANCWDAERDPEGSTHVMHGSKAIP